MVDTAVSLLLIDDGSGLDALLHETGATVEYRIVHVRSLAEAVGAARKRQFEVVLLDPGAGREASAGSLREFREGSPDTQIIVVAEPAALSWAIRSYEHAAFAYVQKPVDGAQLVATIDRALERRRIALYNRRLFWELQTINEIADGTTRSLELDAVLDGALQRVVRAFDAMTGSIRLRDEVTGRYETRACAGGCCAANRGDGSRCEDRPFSDKVIASRTSAIVNDVASEFADLDPLDARPRSALSVPMLAGNDLVGTVTVGAATPRRFDAADERLLGMIAGQILVAVQNARLHDSVRRAKREWERTFDAIRDPIAVFDRNGVLLRGNTALAASLGVPVTALRYSSCRDIGFCGGGCPSCAVGLALGRDEATSADITLPGDEIFSVTTFPVRGTDGVSVVQVAKNVTERIRSARQLQRMSDEITLANTQLVAALDRLKSTQAQLLQAEKLSAIGQLVSGVAHELNNPLTSVIGYAQLLEGEFRDERSSQRRAGSELAADLRHISDEAERAARIVRNLLAFARRQATAREPQDVADLVGRVVSLRSYNLRMSDVELVTEFQPGLPAVVADGGQLQQALLNLILNAEQAMRSRPERRLTVGGRRDDSAAAVEVYVSDTGHGIDPANVSRIFDPFFTTREVGEGTGLGLSICYGIVRDHGGEIAVTTRVQAGTTFVLRLPARVMPERRIDAPDILVGHPDQSEREFLAAALRGWGYRVVVMERADEGLNRYRGGSLHAAVMGWGLVSPCLGDWSTTLLDGGNAVPLVLLAINSADDRIERFGREHPCVVLTPPFQLRALWSAMRTIDAQKEYA